MANTPADVAKQWAGIVGQLCTGRQGQGVFSSQQLGAKKEARCVLPAWAAHALDKRHALHWDASQTACNCLVNGKASLAVVDTGSYKTILDMGMARMLGLTVRHAEHGDCGTYQVPGTEQVKCYAGIVEGEAIVQLAPGVMFGIEGLRVIDHPYPLALLGADILSVDSTPGVYSYGGTDLGTDAQGKPEGWICFKKDGQVTRERLVNVPSKMGGHAVGTRSISMVSGAPLGGQCVRHDPW